MEDALPTELPDDDRHTRTTLVTAIPTIEAAIDVTENGLPPKYPGIHPKPTS